jgi:uncharacterized protein YcbX
MVFILFVLFCGLLALAIVLVILNSKKKTKIIVSALFIYPIKSCAGISLVRHQMDQFGFVRDRKWVVVRKDTMKFVTQREEPKMCLIRPTIHGDVLHVDAPKMSTFELPLDGLNKTGPAIIVNVWNSKCSVFDEGDDAAMWFQRAMGVPYEVRLVRMSNTMKRPVDAKYQIFSQKSLLSFTDAFPLSLVSEESIEALNKLIDPKMTKLRFDTRRFRPNIVVKGCEAWAENKWRLIQIGPHFFYVLKRCQRCKITTINPDNGVIESEEPLQTINRKLHHEFAVNMSHSITSYGVCQTTRLTTHKHKCSYLTHDVLKR